MRPRLTRSWTPLRVSGKTHAKVPAPWHCPAGAAGGRSHLGRTLLLTTSSRAPGTRAPVSRFLLTPPARARTAESTDDFDNVPMTRADYGLGDASASTSADRAMASSKSVGRTGGGPPSSTFTPYDAGHLSGMDLAAAMNAGALSMPAMGQAMGGDGKRYLVHERRSLWGQASYNAGYSYTLGLALGGLYGLLHGVRASPNSNPRVVLNSVLNGCGKFGARAGNAGGVLALVYTITERQLEDVEVDKLPGWLNNATGLDVFRANRSDYVLPAVAALTTGMLFSVPRAGECAHPVSHSRSPRSCVDPAAGVKDEVVRSACEPVKSASNTFDPTLVHPPSPLTLPPPVVAVTMKGVDRVHVSLPKRIAVVTLGGVATLVGVGALATLGPVVFGDRSPFRFA